MHRNSNFLALWAQVFKDYRNFNIPTQLYEPYKMTPLSPGYFSSVSSAYGRKIINVVVVVVIIIISLPCLLSVHVVQVKYHQQCH